MTNANFGVSLHQHYQIPISISTEHLNWLLSDPFAPPKQNPAELFFVQQNIYQSYR